MVLATSPSVYAYSLSEPGEGRFIMSTHICPSGVAHEDPALLRCGDPYRPLVIVIMDFLN